MSLTALEENSGAPELSEGHPPGSPRFRKLESALKQDFWIVFGILALTFLLYLGSLPKQFTNWDDGEYIVNNPLIRSFSLQNLNKIITEPYFANYAPLNLLSYALDYKLWKLNPVGYHFHNVALHLGCVWVLFLLLGRMGLPRVAVLIVTCLFALHPVNVESVSWTSERKNLLATLFLLLSFDQYVRYARARSNLHYLISLLCFMLSILSKASTIVAPLAFLAFDYCFSKKRIRDLNLYDKLPFIVFAEIHAFFSIHAAGASGALMSYHKGGALLSLLASGDLFKEYLALLFWPKEVNPLFLAETVPTFKDFQLWLPFLLLVTTFALLFKWRRLPFFWFSFFAIFLIPVLNIIPLPVMMASRYLYISQIGIWVLLALLLNWLFQFLRPFQLVRATVWAAFGCWLIFITSQTLENTKVWQNSYTLWSYAIEKNFFNPLAHCNLGHWFQEQNMPGRSGHEHLIATLIKPNYHYSLSGIATYYYQKKKWDLAVEALYKGLNAAPDSKEILNNLGKVLIETGQSRRALFMFYRASYANPKNPEAFTNIVIWYVRANQPDEALAVAQTMVKNFPDLAEGYFRVGQALEAKGDLDGAMKAWEEGKKKPLLEDRILKMIDDRMIAARQKQTQRPSAGS